MNNEMWKSLIIKILLMVLTPLAGQLHLAYGAGDLSAIAADLADMFVLAYGIYRASGMKLVPHNSVAIRSDDVALPKDGSATAFVRKPLVNVVGALLLAIGLSLFAQADQAHAATAPAACNLQSLLSGINATNFIARLQGCGTVDVQGAIDDANSAPVDNGALACFTPLQKVVSAIAAQESGQTGLLTAFQKFRRAKQSGVVAACMGYVQTTLAIQ